MAIDSDVGLQQRIITNGLTKNDLVYMRENRRRNAMSNGSHRSIPQGGSTFRPETSEYSSSSEDFDKLMNEHNLRTICSMITEITPENLPTITTKIIAFPINKSFYQQKIIEFIFEKVIDEPSLAFIYARLCALVKEKEVTYVSGNSSIESFKTLLIRSCQAKFDLISKQKKKSVENLVQLNACNNRDVKNRFQIEYDKMTKKEVTQSICYTKFMCELMKEKILKPKIVEMCINHLIKSRKEEALRFVCVIIRHIRLQIYLEDIISKLKKITTKQFELTNPTRTLIVDTINLINNNWIPGSILKKQKLLSEVPSDSNSQTSMNPHQNISIKNKNETLNTHILNEQQNDDSYQNEIQQEPEPNLITEVENESTNTYHTTQIETHNESLNDQIMNEHQKNDSVQNEIHTHKPIVTCHTTQSEALDESSSIDISNEQEKNVNTERKNKQKLMDESEENGKFRKAYLTLLAYLLTFFILGFKFIEMCYLVAFVLYVATSEIINNVIDELDDILEQASNAKLQKIPTEIYSDPIQRQISQSHGI